jgi:hypothetical protein
VERSVKRGVTAAEFAAICARHLPRGSISIESTLAFLDRCCDLGLLRKEVTRTSVRYVATEAASVLAPEEDS